MSYVNKLVEVKDPTICENVFDEIFSLYVTSNNMFTLSKADINV